MGLIEINIGKDFSYSPGPRYIEEGKHSGEQFRKEILYPKIKEALASDSKVIVNLDGTNGYGTSFLEEAFGGLIRINELDYNEIISHLVIISNEEDYLKDDVYEYLKDANEETSK